MIIFLQFLKERKMEKFSKIIYAVINTITGNKYIGATTKTLKERKRDHIQKAKKKVGSSSVAKH